MISVNLLKAKYRYKIKIRSVFFRGIECRYATKYLGSLIMILIFPFIVIYVLASNVLFLHKLPLMVERGVVVTGNKNSYIYDFENEYSLGVFEYYYSKYLIYKRIYVNNTAFLEYIFPFLLSAICVVYYVFSPLVNYFSLKSKELYPVFDKLFFILNEKYELDGFLFEYMNNIEKHVSYLKNYINNM